MKCGFYETEITPPLGCSIFGYLEDRIAREIVTKLYAKAAVLEQGETRVAFLILDALRIPQGVLEVVRKHVYEQTGITEDHILVAATHCHNSVPIWPGKEPYQDPVLDQKTLDMTALLAADAVVMAYQKLHPGNVCFGVGCADGVSFVREYVMKDGTIRTNPANDAENVLRPYSEPDAQLPVFFFTDMEGKPLGSITSFAAHHCCTGLDESISADYSYYVAQNLKNTFGNQFVSLFYAGFCGNQTGINFYGETLIRRSPEIGALLTKELLYTIAKAEPVTGEILSAKLDTVRIKKRELEPGFLEHMEELLKNPPKDGNMGVDDPSSDRMLYSRAKKVIDRYGKDTPAEYDVPVQVIKIGDCMIYALFGEMFSQYGEKIRLGSPTKKNLLVELANSEESCYVPVPELYSTSTVYEATLYSAFLASDAGELLVGKALEIAHTL